MSRSFKKHPAISATWCSESKRRANKRVRHLLKDQNVTLDNARFKRAYCSWNIRDWKEIAPSFEHFFRDEVDHYFHPKRGRFIYMDRPTRKECHKLYQRWSVRK